ncbi:MAG: Clp protease N-terminal domain-containing protein, partial [Actinomycetaceae bacterium]
MDTKLTTRSQEAVASALQHATTSGNPQIEPSHLLKALLDQGEGIAVALLDAVGADRTDLARRTDVAIAALPGVSGGSVAQPQTSRAFLTAVSGATDEARALGDEYVSTEHLLLGLAGAPGTDEILRHAGATPDALRAAVPAVRGNRPVTSPDPENTFDALEKYGSDLTAAAREGKLDPVVGRDAEIRRVVQVLSRRTKNNPVLIGEPGVGKTAVVEG